LFRLGRALGIACELRGFFEGIGTELKMRALGQFEERKRRRTERRRRATDEVLLLLPRIQIDPPSFPSQLEPSHPTQQAVDSSFLRLGLESVVQPVRDGSKVANRSEGESRDEIVREFNGGDEIAREVGEGVRGDAAIKQRVRNE